MSVSVRVLVLGGAGARDALLGRAEGGQHLDEGLAAVVAARFAGCSVEVRYEPVSGISGLRTALGVTGSPLASAIDEFVPDVVVIGVAADVIALAERSSDPTEAAVSLHQDLVAVVDTIKDGGAHVLVCNVSTFVPDQITSNLYGVDVEPVSLRAHRVDLALLQISHLAGVSIIDVDRIAAETGGSRVVPAPLELSPEGSALVRDETLRVLEDYGFFDDRPLVAQVGNRGSRQ